VEDKYKQIAEMIFVRRRRKGISQSELAKVASVSRNYISMIERGQMQNVSLKVIFSICSALDLDLVFSDISQLMCAECGHSKSRHETAGGFCQHCTYNGFVPNLNEPAVGRILP